MLPDLEDNKRDFNEFVILQCDADEEFTLEWNLRFVKAKWLEMLLKDDENKRFELKLKCWDLLGICGISVKIIKNKIFYCFVYM